MLKVLLPILLLVGQASALTLSEIRTEARRWADDSLTTRQRFSDSQINSWINEGQKLIDMRTLCMYDSYSFDLVTGTTYYDLPSNFLMVKRVRVTDIDIHEASPAMLDNKKGIDWEEQEGVPQYYFINFASRTKIGFMPFPDSSESTGTVTVDYIAFSDQLSNDADIPFNGIAEFSAYQYALPLYAAYKMAVIDERTDLAGILYGQFDAIVNLMSGLCIGRPNYKPALQVEGR